MAELEREIAALLGKPAAMFLPSGTMAQQSVFACTPTGAGAARGLPSDVPPATATRARPTSGCTS